MGDEKMTHKINLIDLEPYDQLAKSVVRTIIQDEEAHRQNGKTIPEVRYELLFITSYVSKKILDDIMKRITQADQGLIKKITGQNSEFNKK